MEDWKVLALHIQDLHMFSRVLMRQLKTLSLNGSEIEIMTYLFEKGQMTPLELSRMTKMKKEAVSRILKKLEAMTYVSRMKSCVDERSVDIELTERGRHILDENYQIMFKSFMHLKNEMGEDFELLIDLVRKASDILK